MWSSPGPRRPNKQRCTRKPGKAKCTPARPAGQGSAVRAVLRSQGWRKAFGAVTEMSLLSVQQDLSLLLSVAAKAAKWQEAFEYARRTGSNQAASEAANSWGTGGWQRALQVIQALQWLGFQLAVETLNAASSSCDRRSRSGGAGGEPASRSSWLWSVRCLAEASGKALRASSVTLNSALACLGSSLRWHGSCCLLLATLHRGMVPDDIGLNTVVTACEKTANWELAAEMPFLQRSLSVQPDIIGRNAAMSSCANAGQWRLASVLMSSSEDMGIGVSQVSIAAMATAGERSNQWRLPLHLIDSNPSLTGPILFGAALDALETSGKWTEALELYQELYIELPSRSRSAERKPWLDPMTVSATVSACSRAEEWKHTMMLLNHVRNSSKSGQGLSTAAWNACIRASAGHVSLESLLGWMQRTHFKPDMLSYAVLEAEGAVPALETARLLTTVRSRAMPLLAKKTRVR